MPLRKQEVVEQTKLLLTWRDAERDRLERLYAYYHGRQRFGWLPAAPPAEIQKLAEMSRVNVLQLVVDSVTQSMYVDGYRAPRTETEAPAWELWQRNRLDARQIGVHRSCFQYGAAYAEVLPGAPLPVIRGASPRNLTVVYGEDDEWPLWALEKRSSAARGQLFRLFDETHAYWVSVSEQDEVTYLSEEVHDVGVVPVVRFRAKDDLDGDVTGEIEDLIPLQDQINLTTFGLLVAQHYGAFRQRYILGWLAESEEEKLKASASKLWTFEESPDEIKVGEFEQTALEGYIESREASIRHLAAMSQTPTHELLGQLVNLSAEALAAAEAAHRRKITERETVAGESWEQTLELGGEIAGYGSDPLAEVRWRDTEARAFAATVDALGKLAQMLGVPVDMLWEKIPGWTQQDVERAKAARAEGDAFASLERMLRDQASEPAL